MIWKYEKGGKERFEYEGDVSVHIRLWVLKVVTYLTVDTLSHLGG